MRGFGNFFQFIWLIVVFSIVMSSVKKGQKKNKSQTNYTVNRSERIIKHLENVVDKMDNALCKPEINNSSESIKNNHNKNNHYTSSDEKFLTETLHGKLSQESRDDENEWFK